MRQSRVCRVGREEVVYQGMASAVPPETASVIRALAPDGFSG
jgi:hypothetical protein